VTTNYLGFDLGAESGRAMLGRLTDGRLEVKELHRFPNTPIQDNGGLYWDTPRLWREIQRGIQIGAEECKGKLDGVGIDAWGVDYGLLDADGQLVERPRHYRDARTHGVMEQLFERIPRDEVFAQTGVQFMQLNTLYQLYAMKLAASPALCSARTLLNIPDLFNYWLTGVAKSETTIASTTQFFDPRRMQWATGLLDRLDLPVGILCPLVEPGTLLGKMLEPPHAPVYATAGHDTAAAVAAVPAGDRKDWCYLSSGTWSLMGVELDAPVMESRCLRLNYTNEVGAGGKIRLLKNIAGLWLLQECRRAWMLEGIEYTYAELTRMAGEASPFAAIIDPDAFGEPGDMPGRIAQYCRNSGQQPPRSHAEYVRVVLESLALRYREVLEDLQGLGDRNIETIHIVGGGARNALLNQFVADCTQRRVVAGPYEAAGIGNILIQAMGAGEVATLDELRAVVRRSFDPVLVEPGPHGRWERAYEAYRSVARPC
jgi:rhamnulokinase